MNEDRLRANTAFPFNVRSNGYELLLEFLDDELADSAGVIVDFCGFFDVGEYGPRVLPRWEQVPLRTP